MGFINPGSIQEIMDKIKQFLADDSLFFGLLMLLVAVTAYGLGKHSVVEPVPLEATPMITLTETDVGETALPTEPSASAIVASKNGSKYHYSWCPGASQMKDENKIYFDSIEAARAAGYEPAANCEGLE